MSNKYFDSANNPNRALPYEVARAEQINNTDDLIEAGFNLVKADVNRAIKLPANVTTDQVLTSTAAQRQNSLLAFDASGNATLTGTDVAARTGKVMGWDNSGNIKLYSYANDITAPVNAAAASASAAATSATNSASSATNSANSATASATSATNSASSAALASDWAQKTTGEVVTGQGYSAKYWANEAAKTVAKGVIDDAATSTLTTWSSSKIDTGKQNTLVSGTNIKTINGESVLGSGNISTVTFTGTETLDNKTVKGVFIDKTTTNATATGTVTLNLATADVFNLTLSGNTTVALSNIPTLSNETFAFVVRVSQGGTAYTLTWFSGITWLTTGGTAPAAPSASKSVEYIFSTTDGTNWTGRKGAAN